MGKKIEIQLDEKLYEDLIQQAEAQSLTLEEYLLMVINGEIKKQEYKLTKYKEHIKKEVEILLNKIKGSEGAISNNQQRNKVLIYSFKMYKQKLPKEIDEIIDYYSKKLWFNENYFYLILDKKGIVGYMGLNPQTETMPFGTYLFLYSLNLSKHYQDPQNLKYIAGFLHAVSKKEKYQNVDISSVVTNVDEQGLLTMGFVIFNRTELIKGRVKPKPQKKEYEVHKLQYEGRGLKQEKIQLKELIAKGFVSSGQILPMNFLYGGWQLRESDLDINLLKIEKNHKEIELIIVVEKRFENKERINRYTLLTETDNLFDEAALKWIYNGPLREFLQQTTSGKIQFSVPKELTDETNFIEKESVKEICWYRKITT